MARGAASRPIVLVIVPLMVPFGVAFAVKATGDPDSPAAEAETVCGPGSRPSVNRVVPRPFASLGDLANETEPPPDTTAQLTFTPATGFPWESETLTLSGVDSVVAAGPVWLLPPADVICDGTPAVALATKTMGEPVRPDAVAVAVSTLAPARGPRVHVTDA